MEVAGIELSQVGQPPPIANMKLASLKIHHPRRAKLLQRTVHAGDGHPEGFSQLHKADRRGNLYPTKSRPDQKIDAAVAMMMAIGRAMVVDEEARGLESFLTRPIV